VGATVFPDAVNTTTDVHRVILQSSDGSSRLMEVGALTHLPEVAPPDTTMHVTTRLWRAEEPHEKHIRKLTCAPDHIPMVEEYSSMLVLALQHHKTTQDEYSFECDPVTGAVVCAAAGPAPESDAPHSRPSTLIDTESRPDPPVDAHVEPEDRGASKALTDVPCGLSDAPTTLKEATRRPDWDLWKAACLEEMNGLIDSGTIELATPPEGATKVPSLMQSRLKRDENGAPSRRKGRFCARGGPLLCWTGRTDLRTNGNVGNGANALEHCVRKQLRGQDVRRQGSVHLG